MRRRRKDEKRVWDLCGGGGVEVEVKGEVVHSANLLAHAPSPG